MADGRERRVLMYETFAEIFAAFMKGGGNQRAIHNDTWEWTDELGEQHSIKLETAKRKIRKRGVWGWAQDKATIHLWIKDSTISLVAITSVIAHEMGHIKRPHHRNYHKEEQKACEYEDVAYNAVQLAEMVIEMAANSGR